MGKVGQRAVSGRWVLGRETAAPCGAKTVMAISKEACGRCPQGSPRNAS